MKTATPFSTLKLMHQAMLTAQLFFAGIVFYLVYSKTILASLAAQEKTLQVIALLFAAGAIFGGATIFKKKLAVIKDDYGNTPAAKFSMYRTACIILWALLEAASFICIICLFLTGNYAFLALAAAIIIYFALQAPSKNKVAQQLDISSSDIDAL